MSFSVSQIARKRVHPVLRVAIAMGRGGLMTEWEKDCSCAAVATGCRTDLDIHTTGRPQP